MKFNEKVARKMNSIILARGLGLPVYEGMLGIETLKQRIKDGYCFVAYSIDAVYLNECV